MTKPKMSEIINPRETMARREDNAGLTGNPKVVDETTKRSGMDDTGQVSHSSYDRSTRGGKPPADVLERHRNKR